MLNKIWFGLIFFGLVYGLGKATYQTWSGTTPATQTAETQPAQKQDAFSVMGKKLTTEMIEAAQTSVTLAIALIGVMALWLGFMKIAEDAGLIALLGRALRPILRWLFPGIPRDHPAGGAIIMNFAANMLGLDNAATPLGLKAMKELETLNPHPGTATNSMAMFLAINTSSITLIPFTIIGYRIIFHSQDPARPLGPMFISTLISTAVAIAICRILQPFYPPPTPEPIASDAPEVRP
jgi:spore maturation protein A